MPHSYPPAEVRFTFIPLLPVLLATGALGLVAEIQNLPGGWREAAREKSKVLGVDISERFQRIFFDEPGLDTLFVRGLAGATGTLNRALSRVLRVGIVFDRGRGGERARRAAAPLPLLPSRSYDALMTGILTVLTAIGAARGGVVYVTLLRDSVHPEQSPSLRPGSPQVHLRRPKPPESLCDMYADIDDIYWSISAGHAFKITRVGEDGIRRWLLSLPGTVHTDFHPTGSPADFKSDIREMLGLESAMRVGVVKALHHAMTLDGVEPAGYSKELVTICGHSQGGMAAVALVALPSQKAGVDVGATLATGAPARRIRIREDVTMASVRHDQDVIPSMDDIPARAPDQRVHVGRSFVRPKKSPLYYVHSSATYMGTMRHLERKVRVNPWGRLASSVAVLTDFSLQVDEETRVFLYEVWQELLEPTRTDTEDAFVALDRAKDFEPVDYHMDWSPTPLITLPELSMSAFAPYSRLVSDYVKKVADTPRRILKSMRVLKTIRIGGHRAVPGFERSQEAFRKDIRS